MLAKYFIIIFASQNLRGHERKTITRRIMIMKLTTDDYKSIANDIRLDRPIEYEKGNETLYFDYEYEVEGYEEESTGGFVVTARYLTINDVASYDANGNKTTSDFDEDSLRKEVV